MRKLLTILLSFFVIQASAQSVEPEPVTTFRGCGTYTFSGKHIVNSTVFVSQKKYTYYYVPQEYTSFVVGYSKDSLDIKIVVGSDTFQLDRDEHFKKRKSHYSTYSPPYQTNLIIPTNPSDTILFITNGQRLDLGTIYFINVPKLGKDILQPEIRNKRGNCPEPTTVSYDIWRDGLDPPKQGRDSTQVEHCIIHHSATSNAQTDYVEVMRNIYVYHTEINAWDDIGYNYVVAPDGTIFLGREDQGIADHDNILGAHFCAKNSNTMGICMMGTFTSVSPTTEAIEALTDLLTWKAEKDHLYPFGSSIHPRIVGTSLGNIAGHRDGCSTECPGQMTYNMLFEIRDEVLQKLNACGTFVSVDGVEEEQVKIYPNPSNGVFTIEGLHVGSGYTIYNSLGQAVLLKEVENPQEKVNLTPGIYFITTQNGYRKKIVVQ